MTETVVAFDPGITTGLVVAMWDSGKTFSVERAEEIAWGERFHKVKRTLRTWKPDHIVVEDFILYPHRSRQQIGNRFPSPQMIGIIEAYAYEFGLYDHITKQPAVNRKSVSIDQVHKTLIGTSPHVADAYRHARYFIIVNLLKGKGRRPSNKQSSLTGG